MGMVRYTSSMSLDGYVAGVDQGPDHPLGVDGERLHEWLFGLESWGRDAGLDGGVDTVSTEVLKRSDANVGATIMGRNMFGGGPGPWSEDEPWNGWWGPNPPFHMPVFVLTSHRRGPLVCEGGTTFTFVTDGPEAALTAARAVAGDRDVHISGGGNVARQFLAAGLVDEMLIHLVPVLLGRGVRLFEDADHATALEQKEAVAAPGVTHLTYSRATPTGEVR
jgi:dihydrofolate reductase